MLPCIIQSVIQNIVEKGAMCNVSNYRLEKKKKKPEEIHVVILFQFRLFSLFILCKGLFYECSKASKEAITPALSLIYIPLYESCMNDCCWDITLAPALC